MTYGHKVFHVEHFSFSTNRPRSGRQRSTMFHVKHFSFFNPAGTTPTWPPTPSRVRPSIHFASLGASARAPHFLVQMFHVKHFPDLVLRPHRPPFLNHLESTATLSSNEDLTSVSRGTLLKSGMAVVPIDSGGTGKHFLFVCTEIRHCNHRSTRTILRLALVSPTIEWEE
jgi:hypothetical protein